MAVAMAADEEEEEDDDEAAAAVVVMVVAQCRDKAPVAARHGVPVRPTRMVVVSAARNAAMTRGAAKRMRGERAEAMRRLAALTIIHYRLAWREAIMIIMIVMMMVMCAAVEPATTRITARAAAPVVVASRKLYIVHVAPVPALVTASRGAFQHMPVSF